MGAPKIRPGELQKLYAGKEEQIKRDKLVVKSLIERLNDRLIKDPEACKKAALIIENWLQQKPKK